MKWTAKTIIAVTALALTLMFVAINRPGGSPVYIQGKTVGVCVSRSTKPDFLKLLCSAELSDGTTVSFTSDKPLAEGTAVKYIRRERWLVGAAYQRIPD
jgi:hypothetical protein